jgi:hypothetical protein
MKPFMAMKKLVADRAGVGMVLRKRGSIARFLSGVGDSSGGARFGRNSAVGPSAAYQLASAGGELFHLGAIGGEAPVTGNDEVLSQSDCLHVPIRLRRPPEL